MKNRLAFDLLNGGGAAAWVGGAGLVDSSSGGGETQTAAAAPQQQQQHAVTDGHWQHRWRTQRRALRYTASRVNWYGVLQYTGVYYR